MTVPRYCRICLGRLTRSGDLCSKECMALARREIGAEEEWPSCTRDNETGLVLLGFSRVTIAGQHSARLAHHAQFRGVLRRVLLSLIPNVLLWDLTIGNRSYFGDCNPVTCKHVSLLPLSAPFEPGHVIALHVKNESKDTWIVDASASAKEIEL